MFLAVPALANTLGIKILIALSPVLIAIALAIYSVFLVPKRLRGGLGRCAG